MDIYRSYFYYRSKKDDAPIEEAIRKAAEFGDGFDKIYQRLKKAGYTWNHKKVYRVYWKTLSHATGNLIAYGQTTVQSLYQTN
ncbi:MAG: hypothetical protein J6X91_02045 [Bacteroidales bacterium]|nr:hypothetical protein [Bacteroidales bacterium]